jgi:hypothetical protein
MSVSVMTDVTLTVVDVSASTSDYNSTGMPFVTDAFSENVSFVMACVLLGICCAGTCSEIRIYLYRPILLVVVWKTDWKRVRLVSE